MTESKALVSRGTLKSALLAGLVAGAMDITAAIVSNGLFGVPPMRLLQAVASGLEGKAAFEGGAGAAALGLFLHFAIMLVFASAYALAFEKVRLMRNHTLWCGVLYGIAIYGWMNIVVLPLSAFPIHPTYNAIWLTMGISIHILCVGIPIALITKRYSGPGLPANP
jgi:uncharacterized membrane protein YagU involved in acid resistance